MIPLLPDISITRVSSTIFDTDDELKTEAEAGKTNLFQICSTDGSTEFAATAEQTGGYLLSPSTADKSSKDNKIITNEGALELKGHTNIVDIRSLYTSKQCMPYYTKPDIEYKQSARLDSFPTVSKNVCMPPKVIVKEAHWLTDEKPIWEKQSKMKEILRPYAFKEDELSNKEMVRLVPSCSREARNPGFPSAKYILIFYEHNMGDICYCCPTVSNIPGIPSINEDNNRTWIPQVELSAVFEKQVKTEGLIILLPRVKDEMGALLPSCPKHSPSTGIPLSSTLYYSTIWIIYG